MAENDKDLILAKELVEQELALCDDKDAEFKKRFNAVHDLAVNYRGCMLSFGRLPFRNEVLGRKSTPEEQKFLEENSAQVNELNI